MMIGNANTMFKDEVAIDCILYDDLKDTTDDTWWCLFRKRNEVV